MVDYGQVRGQKQATPSGTRSMTPTEKEVMTTAALTLIPLGTGVAAARLLAKEGLKAATKKFGQKTAEAVSKNKNKFKPVLDPASGASKKLSTTGRYMDPKTGRFLNKTQADLLKKEGVARKTVGVATLAALGTAASMDKPEKNTAKLEPITDAKEVEQRPEPKQAPKPKPELVKRKGPSYSDDMTQSDYGLMEKVRIRDKAEEENIGEAAAEANLKKGGTVRKAKPSKYGMKKGGFTKRGGMYKKGMS
jgi:peptidoglycan hydrolase-like protein with peptidoglycan-binding domain